MRLVGCRYIVRESAMSDSNGGAIINGHLFFKLWKYIPQLEFKVMGLLKYYLNILRAVPMHIAHVIY
ncbi:hypothetical protein DLM85_20730 [Hymenobacter edaphi]|uniref:Uncharacterized protein n=1 Tax=Hymenobacter edaphi TaxID=2211146 RepID=A0A328BFT8_9BACT|nr:hypothetical protein DLM85_20730 [Hymenobacter edaphi]